MRKNKPDIPPELLPKIEKFTAPNSHPEKI